MGICDSNNGQQPQNLTPSVPQDTSIQTPPITLSQSRGNNLLNSEQNINQINQRQNMNNMKNENVEDEDSKDYIKTRPTYVTNNKNS